MTAPTVISPAAADQLAKAEQRIERLAEQLVSLGQTNTDWAYHPPTSDEPKDWTGLLRFVYVDQAYRWYIQRARLLKGGGGPYYCPPMASSALPPAASPATAGPAPGMRESTTGHSPSPGSWGGNKKGRQARCSGAGGP